MGVITKKPPATKKKKKVPPPGRKLNKQEARDYVFKKFGETMKLLAEN